MSSRLLPVDATAVLAPRVDGDDVETLGVDLGLKRLFVGAPPSTSEEIEPSYTVEGEYVRALYDELSATVRRLQATPGDTTTAEAEAFVVYEDSICAAFDRALAEFLAFVDRVDPDVVGVEDLAHNRRPLHECRDGSVEVGTWALPVIRDRLVDALEATGYAVAMVDPAGTTRDCHACGEAGERRNSTLVCETDSCPIDEVDRDESAAATIAQRAVTTTDRDASL